MNHLKEVEEEDDRNLRRAVADASRDTPAFRPSSNQQVRTQASSKNGRAGSGMRHNKHHLDCYDLKPVSIVKKSPMKGAKMS